MKTNSKRIRQLHRWIGLIFSVSALMSAGSGVIHTVLTRTQPPPPAARPAGTLDATQARLSLGDAVAKLPDPTAGVQAAAIRGIGGTAWYQIYVKGVRVPYYVNAATGETDPKQDEIYAAEIAANFLGGQQVTKTAYLTEFNNEYLNIFRLLPVYRFDAADGKGTRVYVSTMTGSIARHTDNRRQVEANIFTNFHKLGFIPNKDIRDLTLALLTTGICVVAITGITLFFVTRSRNRSSNGASSGAKEG